MNQFYKDEIIDPEFFTLDSVGVTAQVLEEETALYFQPAYVSGTDKWTDWTAVTPLTSDWNDTQQWPTPSSVKIGTLYFSADTEYPELCMRFADLWYNSITGNPRQVYYGSQDEEEQWGFAPRQVYDPEGKCGADSAELPDGLSGFNYSQNILVGFYLNLGGSLLSETEERYWKEAGYEYQVKVKDPMANGDNHYRASVIKNLQPYQADGFPDIYYLESDTQKELADLMSMIGAYVKEQVAMFITGERSISEINDFKDELKEMGMDRIVEVYQGVYDQYLANK